MFDDVSTCRSTFETSTYDHSAVKQYLEKIKCRRVGLAINVSILAHSSVPQFMSTLWREETKELIRVAMEKIPLSIQSKHDEERSRH